MYVDKPLTVFASILTTSLVVVIKILSEFVI
jgi:hypothetical protein